LKGDHQGFEIQKRAGQPIQLFDDDGVDFAGFDIGD